MEAKRAVMFMFLVIFVSWGTMKAEASPCVVESSVFKPPCLDSSSCKATCIKYDGAFDGSCGGGSDPQCFCYKRTC
ncbi:hypothetical protein QJS10_CPB11g01443 [Acorus calamus]|uniref:Knottins-like domain-containing protein n=1 Tax=Acorus calamus TaxID=4465 RepID=A0AAV9DSU4_ACOCL|nr:hypothetical protein QJS10_CPB11g01443 [Acorus calamus]